MSAAAAETTPPVAEEDENSPASTKAAELDDSDKADPAATGAKSAADSSSASAPNKITITFRHVGNAPILKRNKFMLERTRNVHFIVEWLKKFMKLDAAKDQLFLYVNQEFSPSPDVDIGTLYDCFRVGNTVILHYCTTPAWG